MVPGFDRIDPSSPDIIQSLLAREVEVIYRGGRGQDSQRMLEVSALLSVAVQCAEVYLLVAILLIQ